MVSIEAASYFHLSFLLCNSLCMVILFFHIGNCLKKKETILNLIEFKNEYQNKHEVFI